MKKISLILALCIPVSLSAAGSVERVYTQNECIQTALVNNLELLTIKEQISLAKARISEARGLVYPKIDLNLSASGYDNKSMTLLAPSYEPVLVPPGNGQYYSTRITLWQNLYASGRYKTNLRLAEANLSKAMVLYDISKNSLIRDIKLEFSELLFLQASIDLLKEQKTKDSRVLNKEIAALELQRQKSNLKLLSLLGIELNTVIQITGDLKAEVEEYELNKCLAWSYQFRPELRQTQFQEAIDTLRVNLSMTERFPTLTLGANYEMLGGSFPGDDKNLSATLNLNVPIFDGWAMFSRIKQRNMQAREGKIRRAAIEDSVQLEVRQAFIDFTYWKIIVAEDAPSVKGPLPITPDKKLDYLQNCKNYLDAKARLEWSMGKNLVH